MNSVAGKAPGYEGCKLLEVNDSLWLSHWAAVCAVSERPQAPSGFQAAFDIWERGEEPMGQVPLVVTNAGGWVGQGREPSGV